MGVQAPTGSDNLATGPPPSVRGGGIPYAIPYASDCKVVRKHGSPFHAAQVGIANREDSLRLQLRMAEEARLIGARIQEKRVELKLTQRELADSLPGKTEGKDVSRWENGHHRPGSDTLLAIAEVLDTTLADLHAGPVAERREQDADYDVNAALNGDQVAAALAELNAKFDKLADTLNSIAKGIHRLAEAAVEQQKRTPYAIPYARWLRTACPCACYPLLA
jgi:transcriptional regulator with XRE-family HTH domain